MIIFFVSFIGIVIYTYKLDKRFLRYMGSLPLTENENDNKNIREKI